MFKLEDGREELTQWDLDRRVIVSDKAVTEVHFCNRTDKCSLCTEVYEDNGARVADIPNILLQSDLPIKVYAYDGCYTKHMTTYKVNKRTQPTDYAYSETEIVTWQSIRKDVDEALEEVGAVTGDIATLQSDVEELKNAPTVITPDLAQNDETAPDYIKNRTHWVEEGRVVIIPETTYTKVQNILDTAPCTPVVNNEYIVTYNGTEYACIGKEFAQDGITMGITIGNQGVLDSSFEDTGEPFLIVYVIPDMVAAVGWAFAIITEANSTITVEDNSGTVHKIDKKYLPDELFIKEGRTFINLGDYGVAFNFNGIFTTSYSGIVNRLLIGLSKKNLSLNDITFNNFDYNIRTVDFNNYYTGWDTEYNMGTKCASTVANIDGNIIFLEVIVTEEAAVAYLVAKKLDYPTWTGGEY